jgi:hypothetical protein
MDIRKFLTKRDTQAKPPASNVNIEIDEAPSSSQETTLIRPNAQICDTMLGPTQPTDSPARTSECSEDVEPLHHSESHSGPDSAPAAAQPGQRTDVICRFDRPNDVGIDSPVQIAMDHRAYPQTTFGRKLRRFNPCWFSGREWLEYSVSRDAAFCFACYKMSNFLAAHQADADIVFTRRGYRNWKKGLGLHEGSNAHCTAMLLWNESKVRHVMGKEINTMVNDEQLERNRYYVQSLIDVVFFLVSNELSLRGEQETEALRKLRDDYTSTDEEHCGLFIKLFEFTMLKDKKLRSIYDSIPANASYTSPSFQNEIIDLLANLVRESIVSELGDKWYTLLCDGTRDATGVENLSIVLRYIDSQNVVCERLLCIGQAMQFDAENLTSTIISYLKSHNVRLDRMLAQCYDGANVMSGRYGGVQALMQRHLQRHIPYIHCFNHQLHLVVVHAISDVDAVASFFDICSQLYNFFRRPNISSIYNGASLKRVLGQRWEGHLAAARTLDKSIDDVKHVLSIIGKKSDEIGVLAAGLQTKVNDNKFQFLSKCMPDLLSKLDSPNKALQSRTASLQEAIDLISETKNIVVELRTEEHFDSHWNLVEKVIQI